MGLALASAPHLERRLAHALSLRGTRVGAVAAGLVALAAAVAFLVYSGRLTSSLALIRHAEPVYVWLAAVAYAGSLVASASAWRTTLAGCGSHVGYGDACARYGVGSLVNSFLPARLGDAARVGLFARTLPASGASALLVATGALASVELAHVGVQSAVVAAAAALGGLPLWPVAALAGGAAVGVCAALLLRRRLAQGPVGRLLEGVDALVRDPHRATRVVGWTVAATGCRIGAAAALAAALGVHSPLVAALLMVAATDIGGLLPLTPGNVGVTSAAIAFALEQHGTSMSTAVACGIAVQAVQTLVGITFGLTALAAVTGGSATAASRRRLLFVPALIAVLAVGGSGVALVPALT
jgi:uncharacterized membrane protein YbhN (UPF0104 family)